MSQTPASPQVTGKMFLFERPELLTKEKHGGLGLNRAEKPFAFCANIRAVPLTISEVITAAKFYPVIFSSEKKATPLAVVGAFEEANLFVDDNGEWEADYYVPAYLRRYPFALATETGGDRVAMVVDAAFEGVGPDSEAPFFDKEELSEQTKSAVEFCRQYEQDRRLTDQIMESLDALDLIVGQSAQFTPPGGEPITFAQYFGVEEQRLTALEDDKFLDLRRRGVLPVLYAHLMSLANWRSLIQRRARRYNLSGEAVAKALPVS